MLEFAILSRQQFGKERVEVLVGALLQRLQSFLHVLALLEDDKVLVWSFICDDPKAFPLILVAVGAHHLDILEHHLELRRLVRRIQNRPQCHVSLTQVPLL